MRLTPLPLLRNLEAGRVVTRCPFCRELVFLHECCKRGEDTAGCPPRSKLEGDPTEH